LTFFDISFTFGVLLGFLLYFSNTQNSISSTQPGLSGVDLGNFLIKNVAKKLKSELPNLQYYSTLSPIPKFKQWMERRGIQLLCNGDIAGVDAALGARVATALQGGGDADGVGVVQARNMEPVLRDALGRAAGHYLYHEKLRSKMICPVGNFHIRNGAIAWRLNVQGGDYTTRGGQSSYGECLCSFYLLYIVFFLFSLYRVPESEVEISW